MKRASTAPVSAARLGVHTVASWGGGLVVILDPVAPGACRVTKPAQGTCPRPGQCALGFGATRLRARGLALCFPGRLACCCLDVCAFPLACAGPCPGPGLLSSSPRLHCAPRETSAVLSSCRGFGPEKSGGNSFPVSCSQGGCRRAPPRPRPRPWVQRPGPRIVQESGEERATGPAQVWPKTGAQQMPPHFPLNSNHM